MVRHFLTILLALAGAASQSAIPKRTTSFIEPLGLRPGDLVLRAGRGWRADAVGVASRSRFTHVGVILGKDDEGRWLVVHAAPPAQRDQGGVRAEPLRRFSSAEEASAVAFWRAPGLDEAARARLVATLRKLTAEHRPFDDAFDLSDSSSVYCTEFVWLAFNEAGLHFAPRTTKVSAVAMSGEFMLPDDLLVAYPFSRITQ